MTDIIHLEVLTPERRILAADVADLQFPTAENGYYGILPGHTPLITALGDGLVSYTGGAGKARLAVFGGFAEVGPDRVTLLARIGETPDMIDVEQAETTLLAAEKRLRQTLEPDQLAQAQADLKASLVRLAAVKHPAGREL